MLSISIKLLLFVAWVSIVFSDLVVVPPLLYTAVMAKESSLGGTSGCTVWNGSLIRSCESFGGGGTGGMGDPGQEEDRSWSSFIDICDCREMLSGVVIMFVDVRTLSGEVMTPAVMYCILFEFFASEKIAEISSAVVVGRFLDIFRYGVIGAHPGTSTTDSIVRTLVGTIVFCCFTSTLHSYNSSSIVSSSSLEPVHCSSAVGSIISTFSFTVTKGEDES